MVNNRIVAEQPGSRQVVDSRSSFLYLHISHIVNLLVYLQFTAAQVKSTHWLLPVGVDLILNILSFE